MKPLILFPFPHFFHPSPPSLFISTITFTSLTSHLPHLPHLPHPLTPSPPSQSGVTKEHATADGQCGHASTRLVPSPWLREEPGQTAAGETAVHSKKGKTSPHSQASSLVHVRNLTCQDCTVML